MSDNPLPDKWYEWHSKRCNVEYRGCAPECPKRAYEETGVWLSPDLIDKYWQYNSREFLQEITI